MRLEVSDNPKRKTKYDLVAVHKQELGWVNMDSQAPNKVVGAWLAKQGYDYIKPQFTMEPGAVEGIPLHRICPRRVATSPPGAFLLFTIFSARENHGILNATNPKP